jgi:hypothetical protein
LTARIKKNTIVWKLLNFKGKELVSFKILNRKSKTKGLK